MTTIFNGRLDNWLVLDIHSFVLFSQVNDNVSCGTKIDNMTIHEIESDMQQLTELVLGKSSDDLESLIKQNCFTVARSFYYSAYCNCEAISYHIDKVLFQRVI